MRGEIKYTTSKSETVKVEPELDLSKFNDDLNKQII